MQHPLPLDYSYVLIREKIKKEKRQVAVLPVFAGGGW
jgi:hypothetical protein